MIFVRLSAPQLPLSAKNRGKQKGDCRNLVYCLLREIEEREEMENIREVGCGKPADNQRWESSNLTAGYNYDRQMQTLNSWTLE